MDQDADEPSDERGVADGAFTNGRSIAATRLSQTFGKIIMNYAGKSYLAPLAKIGAVGSAILLGITVLLTGGFAVIDLLEGDRWVGELWWWRNLIAGTAGLVVLIKTVQYSIRASPSKKTRAYLIATAINLTSCVVLLTVKAMMPSLPMVL